MYTYGTIPQRSTTNSLTTRKVSCESGGQIILARNRQQNIQTNKRLTKGFNEKQVSSVVARELRRALAKGISEEKAEAPDDGIDAEAYIASMVEVAVSKLARPAVSEKVKPKVTLCSILKQSKNEQPLQCLAMHQDPSENRKETRVSALWPAQTMKDPGGLQQLEQIQYSQPIYNNKIFNILAAAMTVCDMSVEEGDGHPRTELDSHANMPVVG